MSHEHTQYALWSDRRKKWYRGAKWWRWTRFVSFAALHNTTEILSSQSISLPGVDYARDGLRLFEISYREKSLPHAEWSIMKPAIPMCDKLGCGLPATHVGNVNWRKVKACELHAAEIECPDILEQPHA